MIVKIKLPVEITKRCQDIKTGFCSKCHSQKYENWIKHARQGWHKLDLKYIFWKCANKKKMVCNCGHIWSTSELP